MYLRKGHLRNGSSSKGNAPRRRTDDRKNDRTDRRKNDGSTETDAP